MGRRETCRKSCNARASPPIHLGCDPRRRASTSCTFMCSAIPNSAFLPFHHVSFCFPNPAYYAVPCVQFQRLQPCAGFLVSHWSDHDPSPYPYAYPYDPPFRSPGSPSDLLFSVSSVEVDLVRICTRKVSQDDRDTKHVAFRSSEHAHLHVHSRTCARHSVACVSHAGQERADVVL